MGRSNGVVKKGAERVGPWRHMAALEGWYRAGLRRLSVSASMGGRGSDGERKNSGKERGTNWERKTVKVGWDEREPTD